MKNKKKFTDIEFGTCICLNAYSNSFYKEGHTYKYKSWIGFQMINYHAVYFGDGHFDYKTYSDSEFKNYFCDLENYRDLKLELIFEL